MIISSLVYLIGCNKNSMVILLKACQCTNQLSLVNPMIPRVSSQVMLILDKSSAHR